LKSAEVRFFQMIDTGSSFERFEIVYKIFRQYKKEKLYVMKRNGPNSSGA
jgi:hypothetical protein